MMTSLVGGLSAAAVTYYWFARSHGAEDLTHGDLPAAEKKPKTTTFNLMILGGQEAIQIILGAIPILVIVIFLVNIFKAIGAIAFLEGLLAPFFSFIGFPSVAVLPIATKCMAGGTAMMGVLLRPALVTGRNREELRGTLGLSA